MYILKIPIKTLIIIALVTISALTAACSMRQYERTCTGIVMSYNTIKTCDGHVWEYENHNKPLSSIVIVTFNTNATNDVTDDTIIDIK